MKDWVDFINEIQQDLSAMEKAGCDTPFFRGHRESDWKLLCGLGRRDQEEFKRKDTETILYYDYMTLAGPLLESPHSSWDVLFSMQNHGLPTRLLDWTLTFSVALYFSIKNYVFMKDAPLLPTIAGNPCIWILDPFELNRSTIGEATVINPHTDQHKGSFI